MTVSIRKLVLSMLNPIILAIAKNHQSIVGFKAIGIINRIFADMFLSDRVIAHRDKGLQKPMDGISAETCQFGYFDCFYVAGKKDGSPLVF